MSESALRPRSGLEIIDAAFSLLRRDYVKFVTIMGIGYLPYLVAVMVMSRAVADSSTTASVTGVFMMILSVFWLTVVNAGMTIAASESYLGRPVDIAAALRQTMSRFTPISVASFLRVAAAITGLLFLGVGAIWAWLTFFAATAIVVLEGGTALDGMRRSAELTRGFKWHVFGTTAITYIIYTLLLLLITIPALVVDTEMLPTVLNALATILIYPMIALVETLLYYDLRIRKEGFDIELMTKDLGDLPAGQPAR